MPEPPAATDKPGLAPGTRVDVRTGFDGSWATGFTVDQVTETGYLVRRRSDDEVLPVEFPAKDVRRERKSMWWV